MSAREFDAAQPRGRRTCERHRDCETILILGTGGRTCWESLAATVGRTPRARPGRHPVDSWTAHVAAELLAELRRHGHPGRVSHANDRCAPNLRQLAEMAGLGVISPVLGHLLHPEFGPWVSLRAALLVDGHPFGERPGRPLTDFEPCTTCRRPCVAACPARTYDASGSIHVERCADHRVGGSCATGCDSLRSCPVGATHRYGPDEEAFRQAHSLFAIRRWLGAGWWRWVPRFVRQRPLG